MYIEESQRLKKYVQIEEDADAKKQCRVSPEKTDASRSSIC